MFKCHTCGGDVEQPECVPPYYDETSFRCTPCVTPEERLRIQQDDARLRASCITWEEIRVALGPKQYRAFERWMDGQTWDLKYGVYRWDYQRFLHNLPIMD